MGRNALLAAAALAGLVGPALLPGHALAQSRPRTATLTDAYNASGQELLRQFSGAPGNIVLSPYSIGSAMSMALSGARGDTEREMLGVLRHRLTRDDNATAHSEVIATLNRYHRSAAPP